MKERCAVLYTMFQCLSFDALSTRVCLPQKVKVTKKQAQAHFVHFTATAVPPELFVKAQHWKQFQILYENIIVGDDERAQSISIKRRSCYIWMTVVTMLFLCLLFVYSGIVLRHIDFMVLTISVRFTTPVASDTTHGVEQMQTLGNSLMIAQAWSKHISHMVLCM